MLGLQFSSSTPLWDVYSTAANQKVNNFFIKLQLRAQSLATNFAHPLRGFFVFLKRANMQMRNTVNKLRVAEPFFGHQRIQHLHILTFAHLHISNRVVQLLLSSLGALSTVLRTALCAVSYTCSIESTANDVIAHTRKVLYTTTANEHDAVFLQVVTFARDV